jgi:anthranilate synthase/aminodeoxychorismate synthase-like glutamine amidotransferase
MLLVIDNYDSFVFNLARYLHRLGHPCEVLRNDQVDVAQVRRMRPDALVLSPGPRAPQEAGCSLDLVRRLHKQLPILGVCLGHQTIAASFGATIERGRPVHGRATLVQHNGAGVFQGLPNPLSVGRYHSLVVRPESLPAELEVTATGDDGTVMAICHRTLPVVGVQFHPESILTEGGAPLLANFLRLAGLPCGSQPDATRRTAFPGGRAPNAKPPDALRPAVPNVPITF